MARTLLTWLTLFALYLLFAGQASGAELCAGALAAIAGALLALYIRRREQRAMRLAAPWTRLVGRVAAALGRDTVAVGAALARAASGRSVRGVMQHQDFEPGGETPEAAGRRALVILAGSVAPNGFVWQAGGAASGGGGGRLLVHRLVPAPPSEDKLWPV